MPRNPAFVRLTDGLSLGIQVDIESGWGISGRDVRHWPEVQSAQDFARSMLQRGIFEEAGQAEWDEVHEGDIEDDDERPQVVFHTPQTMPENKLRLKHSKAERALTAKRAARADGVGGEDDDTSDAEEGSLYSGLRKPELVEAANARGVDSSGTAKDIVARLTAADAEATASS